MGLMIVISIDIDTLTIQLDTNRPYDPKMIYNWSVGLVGDKSKDAIKILVRQLETALIKHRKEGNFTHSNFFYLLYELRDRAEDPTWRCRIWES